jgi:hypothetical protein
MARSAALAVAVVVLLALAGATPAVSVGTQQIGEWGNGAAIDEPTTEKPGDATSKRPDDVTTERQDSATADGATGEPPVPTTKTDQTTNDATTETNEETGETGTVETEGFDPDYDPAEVLRRVETLRGLSATENVTLHEYDEAESGTHDVQDRFGAIRPAGARTLQLYSNASTDRRQPLGYTVDRDSVHVYLMNASDVAQYGVSQEAVLAHELVHALQFQHDLLTPSRTDFRSQFQRWTTDARLVTTALVEGDAMWVTEQYLDRHDRGNYSVADYNRTLARAAWPHSVAGLPYYYGYRYYEATGSSPEERTATLAQPPNVTAELLHPDASIAPAPLPDAPDINDADKLKQYHTDTVGELVVRHAFRMNGLSFARSADLAEGLANDRMYYYVAEAARGPTTHWVTVWENASEAREFAGGWRALLRENGAESVGDTLHVPASDEASGLYYVIEQDDDAVRVTAAPSEELAERLAESA